MFETAMLSRRFSRPRSFALPGSILLHAAAIALLVGASLWRSEEMGAPMQPIRFIDSLPAPPPPIGSRAGAPETAKGPVPLASSARPAIATILPALPRLPASGESGEVEAVTVSFGDPFGDPESEPGSWGDVPGGVPKPGSPDEKTYVPGGDVRAPVLLQRVEPDYPEVARKARIEGVVILQAIIGPTGAIEDLRLVKSLFPALDESALAAVRRWRYRPATLNGRAVRVLLSVTVAYRLR